MWILAPGQNVSLFCWSLHDANIFHLSRPSHWNCTSVEEALILLLRLNDMLQVCSFISAHPCVTHFVVQQRFGAAERRAIPKAPASAVHAR